MKWEKEDEDLDKRISKALAALKGGDHEYMQQSADPVNLSTGNFLYKKTDLVIRGSRSCPLHAIITAWMNVEGSSEGDGATAMRCT